MINDYEFKQALRGNVGTSDAEFAASMADHERGKKIAAEQAAEVEVRIAEIGKPVEIYYHWFHDTYTKEAHPLVKEINIESGKMKSLYINDETVFLRMEDYVLYHEVLHGKLLVVFDEEKLDALGEELRLKKLRNQPLKQKFGTSKEMAAWLTEELTKRGLDFYPIWENAFKIVIEYDNGTGTGGELNGEWVGPYNCDWVTAYKAVIVNLRGKGIKMDDIVPRLVDIAEIVIQWENKWNLSNQIYKLFDLPLLPEFQNDDEQTAYKLIQQVLEWDYNEKYEKRYDKVFFVYKVMQGHINVMRTIPESFKTKKAWQIKEFMTKHNLL